MEKEKSKNVILSVDLGNYNIKTSTKEIFISTFVKVDKIKDENDPCMLKYNNEIFLMERGKFDNEFNKAKKDYIPNLLYAISKSIKPSENTQSIKLLLGVPISNLGIKHTIISNLLDNTFNFKVSNKKYSVKFDKVGIIGEGISSYYMLPETIRIKDVMIIDIGGRTTNICCYKNCKLVISFTIPLGTINLFDSIIQEANLEGNNYEVELLQEYIEKKIVKPSDKCYEDFINELYNQIKLKADIRLFKPILTGGGSILLRDYETSLEMAGFKNLLYMEEALFSNVLGNKKIADAKWGNIDDDK